MIETLCGCGAVMRASESWVGTDLTCHACQNLARLIAGEGIEAGQSLGDFDTRLVIDDGPADVGRTYILGGLADLTLGKATDHHVPLDGALVSRSHAKLVRLDFGPSRWKVVDTRSRNGLYVNDEPVSEVVLRDGDRIRIGEYVLRYGVGFAPLPKHTGPTCPACKMPYSSATLICTSCGIDIKTGKPLVTSKDIDEDDITDRVGTFIYVVSWVLWLGLFPVASEAYGTYKPRATWIITAVTVLVSLFFLLGTIGNGGGTPPELKNWLMWTGSRDAQTRHFEHLAEQHPDDHDEIMDALAARQKAEGEFHIYQLLTNAFLHEGIFHLAGNLLFLLVFGLRVNELIGDAKMWVVYPVLAVLASLSHWASQIGQPMMASLGASGAIMGLAGMYLVFFPVQRVHMIFWKRSIFLMFRWYSKMFTMKGFWLLVLWLGLNDVLPTLIAAASTSGVSGDHVAHFAHLGGFVSGVVIALLLLLTRQVNARGADLLSVWFGPRAWVLIGTPEGRGA